MPRMTIKAAGYVRVSSKQQAEGESLNEQESKVTRRIQAEGWELTEVYVEAGRSGRRADRPELQRMLAAVDGIDRLVIPRLDRLGRSASDLFTIYKKLDDANVGLVSIRESFDTSTPMGKLVRSVLSAIAELESDQIAERLEDNIRRRRENGLYLGAGARPYGYRFAEDGSGLVIEPVEAEVIRRIYAEYNAGKSMRQIALGLTADGIPGGRGGRWSSARVREKIENVIYRGDLGSRLHDDVRPGVHEAIVDRETWAKANARRSGQRRQSGKGVGRSTNALLPGGFFKCLNCGAGMRPQAGRPTYRCSGRDELKNGCELGSIPRALVDEALRTYFLEHVFDPDASRREFEAERERARAQALALVRQATADVATARRRRENMRRALQDGMPYAEWREHDDALAAEEADAEQRVERARRAAEAVDTDTYQDWQSLREHALGDLSRESDRLALRAALQRLFDYIAVGYQDPDQPDDGIDFADVVADLPTFEYRGRRYWLYLEIRPDAMLWEQDGEPAPWPAPTGLPGMNASAARCGPAVGSSPRRAPPATAAAPPAAPRAAGAAAARRRPRSSRSARRRR